MITIDRKQRRGRGQPVASAHSPGTRVSSAKAARRGAIAAPRGHTPPAHAALARRRAHAPAERRVASSATTAGLGATLPTPPSPCAPAGCAPQPGPCPSKNPRTFLTPRYVLFDTPRHPIQG